MELRYGTVLLIVWLWYSYREAETQYLVPAGDTCVASGTFGPKIKGSQIPQVISPH